MSILPELGSTVLVRNQQATVRYVGATDFAEGVWVGLELLRPVGRNDGSVHGVRYFTCDPQCGLFVPPSHVYANPIAIADASAAPEQPKSEIASVWSNVESLQEGEALQAARKAERVMRHLSENYPTQSSTGGRGSAALKRAQGKPGAARLNRQLSRDGDKGYEAVIEGMALPANYSGPTMAADLTVQGATSLLAHIKAHAARGGTGPAVPKRVAMQVACPHCCPSCP
eukprot:Transcript_22770.p1 GENE.Transcript_22770~~Transcript_22770.p1  ORF type:complete len:228 (-),score=10.41 Transcript_22770:736-1419(-)